eukprot:scaffold28951_cov73-Isochrysis_galbana.AAC.1
MPANALDLITCHFGVEAVAEMTGRKMRFVPAAGGGSRWEARATAGVSHDQINISEKDAFLAGTKRIAIISDAASSGARKRGAPALPQPTVSVPALLLCCPKPQLGILPPLVC